MQLFSLHGLYGTVALQIKAFLYKHYFYYVILELSAGET